MPVTVLFLALLIGTSFSCTFAFLSTNSKSKSCLSGRSMSLSAVEVQKDSKIFKSPCKINLFLRITSRQPNGYHNLASIFQTISLADTLTISPIQADKDILTCSDSSLVLDSSNLIIKALDLMRKKTGIKSYFRIHLDKLVPMQAGLGGGSGNAATAMHAFNVFNSFPANLMQLRQWSAEIGSDISFFFSSGTAYCTGRGEVVEDLPLLKDSSEVDVHVFKPIEGLSTALVFKALDLQSLNQISPVQLKDQFIKNGILSASHDGALINDLEKPAFYLSPRLQDLKNTLSSFTPKSVAGVVMSGSGTSVYAICSKNNATNTKDPFIENVLSKFSDVKHFKCELINKSDSLFEWY